MNSHRILIIDDDPSYCKQLVATGRDYRFDIVFYHNLEEGMEALVASRRIKAVILDGHCFLEPDQQGIARSNFVHHALHQIADIENEYSRVIPCCVNTEHAGDFREDLEGVVPVFQKNVQEGALFDWLRTTIAQLPETLVRKRYDDLFERTALYFSEEEEDLLIDIIQSAGKSDQAAIITSLASLRKFLEILMDKVYVERFQKNPEDILRVKGGRTVKILDEFHQSVLPPELYVTATQLYKTCSKYGINHDPSPKNRIPYKPGKYALNRLLYSYLELADFLLKKE
jgi:hypothetical protein